MDKYRRDGVADLVKDGTSFIKRGGTLHVYQLDRVDLEERWDLMNPHLDEDHSTVLDVGCAEGLLTAKFADRDMFCIGVDTRRVPLEYSRKNLGHPDGVALSKFTVTPENVDRLPEADVVLLLSVFQWWIDQYGGDAADEMLRTLGRNSEMIFFEAPNWEFEHPPISGVNGETLVDYHVSFLDWVFDGKAEITHLGDVSYKGGERTDPVFAVSTADV